MLPIGLDPALPVAVAGRGLVAQARHARLAAAGLAPAFFTDAPSPGDPPVALPRLPAAEDLARLRLLWVAGLPEALASRLAQAARAARLLVNVEDVPDLCDFHSLAEVRRGDLVIAVSTGGRSPALASRLRARLEDEFGPEWAGRLAWLGERRRRWRARGLSGERLARISHAAIDAKGWL